MRILHVLAQLPARTGSGVFYANLIRSLQPYQHEQRALFACQDGAVFDFLPPQAQYPVCFQTPTLPFPIAGMSDVMPYPSTVYSQMDSGMLEQWQAAFGEALSRAQREFQPEVVVTHHLWMLTSMVAARFPDAVTAGICHNTDLRQALQNPQLTQTHASHIAQLDTVFALSESQKPQIQRIYGVDPERLITVGGGFDETIFYPGSKRKPDAPVSIVYATKIDPAKGIYSLLQAFERVTAAGKNVRLYIVGTPDRQNAQQIQSCVAGKVNIVLLPAMPQRELADFFRQMDLYVLPSFFEGLGLTVLESLACGLRVVATEIDGLQQLLGEGVHRNGAIEYVPLPRMQAVGRPVEDDLGQFADRLAEKLLLQIGRIENGDPFPPVVLSHLQQFSWSGIAHTVHRQILCCAIDR